VENDVIRCYLTVTEPLISDQSLDLGDVSKTFGDIPSKRRSLRIFTGQELIESFLERRSLIESLLRQFALASERPLEVDLNTWHVPSLGPKDGGRTPEAAGATPGATACGRLTYVANCDGGLNRRNRVATRVATQADSGVTQRSVAASSPGCSEPKWTRAAHPEPSAITVRDRVAPGSNPGPPTTRSP
jgi:hypothetical protein